MFRIILEKLVHVLPLAGLMSLVSLVTFAALVGAYKLLF
jgi:hypothetical protein